jgi:hypothetical protein
VVTRASVALAATASGAEWLVGFVSLVNFQFGQFDGEADEPSTRGHVAL